MCIRLLCAYAMCMAKHVSMLWPEALWEAVQGRVGKRGVTAFVLAAVEERLGGQGDAVADGVSLAVPLQGEPKGATSTDPAAIGGVGLPVLTGPRVDRGGSTPQTPVVEPFPAVGDGVDVEDGAQEGVEVHPPILPPEEPQRPVVRRGFCPHCGSSKLRQVTVARSQCRECGKLFDPR